MTMEIYPAVDLYEGKVVRLERGDYKKCTVYSENPADIARKWEKEGARWIHVVDLEGAKSGEIRNWESLKEIVSSVKASVQFGGGIRSKEDVESLLKLGVQRVVIGTKALDTDFLKEVTRSFGEKTALSLDLRGEEIQIEGWLKSAKKSIFDFLGALEGYKIGCLIITDIEKDGMLKGIDVNKWSKLLEKSPFPVICAGGFTSLEDISSLVKTLQEKARKRLNGVIVGKALYEGKFNLKEALAYV